MAGTDIRVSESGLWRPPASVTKVFADSPYTVLVTDFTIRADATGGAMAIDLPAATGSGRIINVKKIDASANTVTVDGSGAEAIDGQPDQVISVQYDSITIQDGAAGAWDII